MGYPVPDELVFPIVPYAVTGYSFRQRVWRRLFLWATHLGDDIDAPPGTAVVAIGSGEVVWSEMRLGSATKRNWGGVVVIGHGSRDGRSPFFSIYGHVRDLAVHVGDQVVGGQEIGLVAEGSTPENGWWQRPHLHFAVYVGPWRDVILPGYKRPEEFRTKLRWWRNPKTFIEAYNLAQRPQKSE